MLKMHYSLTRSRKILNKLIKDWPRTTGGYIEAWSNGREQGYAIKLMERRDLDDWQTCVFAQQRSSDQVIMIAGSALEFDVSTNMPSEKIWSTAKYFNTDNEAIVAILKWCKQATKELV